MKLDLLKIKECEQAIEFMEHKNKNSPILLGMQKTD